MNAAPPGGEVLRVVLRGHPAAEVRRAQQAVAGFLAVRGVGPRSIARAELVVEEVALNALRHGFPEGAAAEIGFAAWVETGPCVLAFEDRGVPFNPTRAALPAAPAGLGTARIGGLGVPLIRRTTAELRYERTPDGRNLLRLVLPKEDAAIG